MIFNDVQSGDFGVLSSGDRCAAKLKDDSLCDAQASYFGDYFQLPDSAMGEIEALHVERQATNRHMGSFDALYESVSLDRD